MKQPNLITVREGWPTSRRYSYFLIILIFLMDDDVCLGNGTLFFKRYKGRLQIAVIGSSIAET